MFFHVVSYAAGFWGKQKVIELKMCVLISSKTFFFLKIYNLNVFPRCLVCGRILGQTKSY